MPEGIFMVYLKALLEVQIGTDAVASGVEARGQRLHRQGPRTCQGLSGRSKRLLLDYVGWSNPGG